MNQTVSPIEKIQNQFPDAVYFTPTMISATVQLSREQVYKYCRQLWPRHEGHYRFWIDEAESGKYGHNMQDLQILLRLIRQNQRK